MDGRENANSSWEHSMCTTGGILKQPRLPLTNSWVFWFLPSVLKYEDWGDWILSFVPEVSVWENIHTFVSEGMLTHLCVSACVCLLPPLTQLGWSPTPPIPITVVVANGGHMDCWFISVIACTVMYILNEKSYINHPCFPKYYSHFIPWTHIVVFHQSFK